MRIAVPFACFLLASAASGALLAQGHSELKPIAFSALDTNKDGKLSRSEARADPELYEAFDMLDVNHDGFLTPAEFQAWPRALKATNATTRDPATAPSGSAGAQHMPPTN
jgi:hypothetical protein